jgi:hypothetical protein
MDGVSGHETGKADVAGGKIKCRSNATIAQSAAGGLVADPKSQRSPRERCQARAHEDEADDQRGEGRQGGGTGRVAVQGYTSYIVQDLVIRIHVVGYRCERWVMRDGTVLTASLLEGIQGTSDRTSAD